MPKESLIAFSDGGARGNPGPAAAAAVVEDSAGKKRFLCGKYLGVTTNNEAEYYGVKLALETIKENYPPGKSLQFYVDSALVANQLSGLYKVKSAHLGAIIFEIRKLENHLGEIYYHYVPREKNREADKLVNQVLDRKEDIKKIVPL